MIEGLNVRCNVGPFEVLRSPHLQLIYRRRAVVSRASIHMQDGDGQIRAGLAVGQAVRLRFGYRGPDSAASLWHDWQGRIARITQAGQDTVAMEAVGREQALLDTRITESFYGEPAAVVARRLLQRTGLPVAAVDIPDVVLPHQVFSQTTVARAIKQLDITLARAFGHDLLRHALWLSKDGWRWSAGGEPGDTYLIESAANLLEHEPPETEGGMGRITAALLPGLTHSRTLRIRDARRGFSEAARAQEVLHDLSAGANITTVLYGADEGWG